MSQKNPALTPEKKKDGLLSSTAALSSTPYVAHISFSFAIAVIFLVELLLISCLAGIGFLGLREYTGKMESSFHEQGRTLTLSLVPSAALTIEKNNYRALVENFTALASREAADLNEKTVSEVFLLRKDGTMLAHSDITLMTASSKDPVNAISLRYNNEFFHSPLLLESGQFLQQQFPYPDASLRQKKSHFLESLLPKSMYYSVDFGAPVFVKGKAVASLHVVMNRMYVYQFLVNLVNHYIVITGVVMLAGLLASLLLLFGFVMRARYLFRVWQNIMRYRLENQMVNHEIHVIEEKVERLGRERAAIHANGEVIEDAIPLDQD